MTASPDPLSPVFCLLTFRLRNDVAIEDFGGRSLVLLAGALELREINAAARRLAGLLDGKRTVADIAAETGMPVGSVAAALLEMEQQGVVRRAVNWSKERREPMSEARYLADPDVSFRTEGDDGGLLYNAETDTLEVINPVAVEIWKHLSAPHTRAEVAAHLAEVCEGAAPEQVERDVAEFLNGMVQKGFIGVVEEPA
ncbi:MAG: PqqD family peptide modification chaperone [Kiritimatiellae bacterium]|nr:PqqD family peptide modification chaperone [Kiritimatiellia bacterium]